MMGLWLVPVLLVSLGLTIALEEAFGWLAGVRDWWNRLLIVLVNILTNPAVVFLYYVNDLYLGWNPMIVTVALEAAQLQWKPYATDRQGKYAAPGFFRSARTCFLLRWGRW